jgi:hypothetical protein
MDVNTFYSVLAGLSFTLLGTQSAWLVTFASSSNSD